MGNILAHADNKHALSQQDAKWLKMRAAEYFEAALSEEYTKLPAFEGTERTVPRSQRDGEGSGDSQSGVMEK